jgi:hypothetical protein
MTNNQLTNYQIKIYGYIEDRQRTFAGKGAFVAEGGV